MELVRTETIEEVIKMIKDLGSHVNYEYDVNPFEPKLFKKRKYF